MAGPRAGAHGRPASRSVACSISGPATEADGGTKAATRLLRLPLEGAVLLASAAQGTFPTCCDRGRKKTAPGPASRRPSRTERSGGPRSWGWARTPTQPKAASLPGWPPTGRAGRTQASSCAVSRTSSCETTAVPPCTPCTPRTQETRATGRFRKRPHRTDWKNNMKTTVIVIVSIFWRRYNQTEGVRSSTDDEEYAGTRAGSLMLRLQGAAPPHPGGDTPGCVGARHALFSGGGA